MAWKLTQSGEAHYRPGITVVQPGSASRRQRASRYVPVWSAVANLLQIFLKASQLA